MHLFTSALEFPASTNLTTGARLSDLQHSCICGYPSADSASTGGELMLAPAPGR